MMVVVFLLVGQSVFSVSCRLTDFRSLTILRLFFTLYLVCILQAAFRALAGKGYQTLQSLLLDIFHWRPSEGLLNALLDMLVDGKFDMKSSPIIKVV